MFGLSLSLFMICALPEKRISEIRVKISGEAVAVNAVTTSAFNSFKILLRFRYEGLKVSPHSETQWASSIAMWLKWSFLSSFKTEFSLRTSGFAMMIFASFLSSSKISSRSSCDCPPWIMTFFIFPSSIRLFWSFMSARSG